MLLKVPSGWWSSESLDQCTGLSVIFSCRLFRTWISNPISGSMWHVQLPVHGQSLHKAITSTQGRYFKTRSSLWWRHNGRDGVSKHQPHDCSTVYSGADQSKHQSSASLAFVWVIHRWPMNSLHKWPVTRKVFPFDDVIMHIHKGPLPSRSIVLDDSLIKIRTHSFQ